MSVFLSDFGRPMTEDRPINKTACILLPIDVCTIMSKSRPDITVLVDWA